MSTSKAEFMPNSSTVGQERQATQFLHCKLRWRQKYLIVTLASSARKMHLLALDMQRLIDCLKLSQVKGVCIDAALGEASVKLWADACAQANKTAFLRLSPQLKKAKRQNILGGKLQESLERAIAALLILLLAPVLLGLFYISCLYSSNPLVVERQWYANKQGKLFRLYKFQTIANINTQLPENGLKHKSKYLLRYRHQLKVLGQWLHKYQLDRLPKLFNVLRGEIGIVEQHYLTLEQAVRLSINEPLLETLCQAPDSECNVDKLQPAGVEYKH